MVSGKYVYAGKKRCAKYQKFILIPDNASWYTAIRSESLIKASYKIVKRLFGLNYILQKYHRSVSNVGLLLAYNLCMQIVKKLGREKMFAMACAFPIIGLIIIAIAGFVAPTNPVFVIIGAGILKFGSGLLTVVGLAMVGYNASLPQSSYLFDGNRTYSLEHLKQEYPSYGTTDYREPAFEILQENGSRISDFTY